MSISVERSDVFVRAVKNIERVKVNSIQFNWINDS